MIQQSYLISCMRYINRKAWSVLMESVKRPQTVIIVERLPTPPIENFGCLGPATSSKEASSAISGEAVNFHCISVPRHSIYAVSTFLYLFHEGLLCISVSNLIIQVCRKYSIICEVRSEDGRRWL